MAIDYKIYEQMLLALQENDAQDIESPKLEALQTIHPKGFIPKKLYYKSGQTVKETNQVLENNEIRLKQIQKNFVQRKKELTEYTNSSIEYLIKNLNDNNIYFTREKTFFDLDSSLFFSDFYIPYYRLTIELDGGYHEESKRKYLDEVKSNFLANRSICTIRFKNEEIFDYNLNSKFLKLAGKTQWDNYNIDKRSYDYWIKIISFKSKLEASKHLIELYIEKYQSSEFILDWFKPIKLIDKDNNILWVFENIFYTHFRTGKRFKDIISMFDKGIRKKVTLEYCTPQEVKDFLKNNECLQSFVFHSDSFYDAMKKFIQHLK